MYRLETEMQKEVEFFFATNLFNKPSPRKPMLRIKWRT
jgi:hypothetical protein